MSGLLDGEVLSVQSEDAFEFRVTKPDQPEGPDAGTDPDPDPEPDAGPQPDAAPEGAPLGSQMVTWTCTSSPCPWGPTTSNPAVVWPTTVAAGSSRLGYTVSGRVYLPAGRANGATITVEGGVASALAGLPGATEHRFMANISGGQTFHVNGIGAGEVFSVQGDSHFTYRVTLPSVTDPEDDPPDVPPGDVVHSAQAFWRCNVPDCFGAPWTAAVISWPPHAAFQNNARAASQSRSVFDANNNPLFPYMQGSWVEGCEVTVVSGIVLIVEWQRGTDVWRETWLQPGQSHTIHLVPPEDGAMIETFDGSPGFSVTLRNCTPPPAPTQGVAAASSTIQRDTSVPIQRKAAPRGRASNARPEVSPRPSWIP